MPSDVTHWLLAPTMAQPGQLLNVASRSQSFVMGLASTTKARQGCRQDFQVLVLSKLWTCLSKWA